MHLAALPGQRRVAARAACVLSRTCDANMAAPTCRATLTIPDSRSPEGASVVTSSSSGSSNRKTRAPIHDAVMRPHCSERRMPPEGCEAGQSTGRPNAAARSDAAQQQGDYQTAAVQL